MREQILLAKLTRTWCSILLSALLFIACVTARWIWCSVDCPLWQRTHVPVILQRLCLTSACLILLRIRLMASGIAMERPPRMAVRTLLTLSSLTLPFRLLNVPPTVPKTPLRRKGIDLLPCPSTLTLTSLLLLAILYASPSKEWVSVALCPFVSPPKVGPLVVDVVGSPAARRSGPGPFVSHPTDLRTVLVSVLSLACPLAFTDEVRSSCLPSIATPPSLLPMNPRTRLLDPIVYELPLTTVKAWPRKPSVPTLTRKLRTVGQTLRPQAIEVRITRSHPNVLETSREIRAEDILHTVIPSTFPL